MKVITILVVLVAVGFVAYRAGQGNNSRPPVPTHVATRAAQAAAPAAPAQAVAPSVAPAAAPPAPRSQAPAPPSQAPAPPTAPPDTPPGTVLDIGQTWRQGSVELSVLNPQFLLNGKARIQLQVQVKNISTQPLALKVSPGSFTAADNNNRPLTAERYDFGYVAAPFAFDAVVNPGQVYTVGGNVPPVVTVDFTSPSITFVTVRFSGISSITDAAWKIPINH